MILHFYQPFGDVIMNILPASKYGDYLEHLLALDEDDRYFRFCSVLSDEAITNYVDKISSTDVIIAQYDEELKIVGAVQLIFYKNAKNERIADFGISVLKESRGNGLARKLLERAILYAKNHGVEKMCTLCLVTNRRMQHLAKNSGLTVQESDEGKQALLELDSPNSFSLAEEIFSEYIGICELKNKELSSFTANMFEKLMYPLRFFSNLEQK